jgi:hypothetical protein
MEIDAGRMAGPRNMHQGSISKMLYKYMQKTPLYPIDNFFLNIDRMNTNLGKFPPISLNIPPIIIKNVYWSN